MVWTGCEMLIMYFFQQNIQVWHWQQLIIICTAPLHGTFKYNYLNTINPLLQLPYSLKWSFYKRRLRKKKIKKPTYKRGISTMSWMRQHNNSSMRSSHSAPKKKHSKGFLGFQIPKQRAKIQTHKCRWSVS